ncbi:hypothetical protein C8R44DRAFT_745463 [Mycena epipterygia]|nr:hypothetical protein C8R44DRAFT_745463 [Mycena epipterygia]
MFQIYGAINIRGGDSEANAASPGNFGVLNTRSLLAEQAGVGSGTQKKFYAIVGACGKQTVTGKQEQGKVSMQCQGITTPVKLGTAWEEETATGLKYTRDTASKERVPYWCMVEIPVEEIEDEHNRQRFCPVVDASGICKLKTEFASRGMITGGPKKSSVQPGVVAGCRVSTEKNPGMRINDTKVFKPRTGREEFKGPIGM